MWAALAALCVLAAGPPAQGIATVRSEGRASLLRPSMDGGVIPLGDLALGPGVLLARDDGRWLLSGAYQADLRLRATFDAAVPVWSQALGLAAATGAEERGGRFELTGLVSGGQLTFDTVGEDVDQPVGLNLLGGLFPMATARLGSTFSVLAARRLRIGAEGGLGAFATPPLLEDPAARGVVLAPWVGGDVRLRPQLLPEALVFAEPLVTRRDTLRFEARVDGAFDTAGARYAGATPSLTFKRRLHRAHDASLKVGSLFGEAVPLGGDKLEPVVLPVLEASATGRLGGKVRQREPASGVSYNASLALEPFYDAFLGVLTERAALRAAATWSPWAYVDLIAGVDSSAWLSAKALSGGPLLDAYITSGRLEARVRVVENVFLEAGGFTWIRAGMPGVPAPAQVSLVPEWSLFLALITGLPFEV